MPPFEVLVAYCRWMQGLHFVASLLSLLSLLTAAVEAFSLIRPDGGPGSSRRASSRVVRSAGKKTMAKKASGSGAAKKKGGFGAATAKASAAPKPATLATTNEAFSIREVDLVEGVSCDIGSQGPDVPISTLFMGAYLIEDESVIDGLNELYDSNPSAARRGVVGRDGKAVVDTDKKDSFEITFMPDDKRPEWARYVTALQQCTVPYCTKYEYAANYVGPWGLSSPTNLQHYPPGGGYKTFHTERRDRNEPGASRHLVFMTYLNDVNDAGGTEFYHQNIVIRPRKGLTLIWPSDWTFMHRGVASPTEEKRIMTGWFNFS